MVPEIIATAAARLFLGKVAQDAALDFGNEVIKTSVERLKLLIRFRLTGKPELEQSILKEDPVLLKNAIVEAFQDDAFSTELIDIVRQIQPDEAESSQMLIENSTVGTVATNFSGGQSVGSMSGGVAAERIDNFHLGNDV